MTFDDLLKKWNGGVLHGAPRKLAAAAGVQESYVSKMRRGVVPGEATLEKVAKILGVKTSELEELLAPVPSGVDMSSLAGVHSFVPVLGAVAADRFNFSLDAIPEEQIPNPYPGKNVFALRVHGDCMEPTFGDGEYIYFSLTQPVGDGKIVLARLDGEHTVKRYFKRTNGIELRPDNKKYPAKTYATNKLEIVAVAVGGYKKV